MASTTSKRTSNIQKESQTKKREKRREMKHAYRLTIEMEDYLFFASMEKGKVTETSPLIHNYALAYALGWTTSPYFHSKQSPAYRQQLEPLNDKGHYIYPAVPIQFTHTLMQYNTTEETFSMVREKSLGFPNWGFIKCIRPGSQFYTYALSASPLSLPGRFRLGKWMSQAQLTIEEIAIQKSKKKNSPHLLNVWDLKVIPQYFGSLFNLLPSRLVKNAEWDSPIAGYTVSDGDSDIFLPACQFVTGGTSK
ncbi:type I-D CRISPR-associated protein Cas5/Csc1 [Hazenella sp. IB182353]|uniref:type I-D CRISPR-associated protein Cas5/Csc1 n=1 Tax=Polycladospora coralii TaxID=2771432 RepID=UPI001745DE2A|nr:type I-D CRISPR-associated protein Cas5/Csc1 [Polycladospora coralii]MBS7531169.1 type I-D CRISPR-associated protein Cas5/Csc1 [Polycladospora coralii]